MHLDWLEAVLAAGLAKKELRDYVRPDRAARLILSTLQGASLVAWALKDPGVVRPVLKDLIASLTR